MLECTNMQNHKPLSLPASILIAGGFIAVAIIAIHYLPERIVSNTKTSNTENSVPSSSFIKPDDHVRGAAHPRVTFIEYADLECPYCKVFHTDMEKIIATYPNDVAWVYRHFPLESLHAHAFKEAEAAECIALQGGDDGFWNFIDAVYTKTTSNDTLDPKDIPIIAKELGFDPIALQSCIDTNTTSAKVTEQQQEAIQSGGQGTPYTMMITDKGQIIPISGAESFDNLKKFLDSYLAPVPTATVSKD